MRSVIGVCNGEFGWEVSQFVPAFRHFSRNFDRAFMLCRSKNYPLYKDFAEFTTAEAMPRTHVIFPYVKDRLYPRSEMEFLPDGYGILKPSTDDKLKVCIHTRNTTISFKNYPLDKWLIIIEYLHRQDIQIFLMGRNEHVYGISHDLMVEYNLQDYANATLDIQMDIMKNSDLMVGTSSGPMVLAQQCKTPILAWCDQKTGRGQTARQRYEKFWNAYDTPAWIIDEYGWQLQVDIIIAKLNEVLKLIRERKAIEKNQKTEQEKNIIS